MTGQVFKAYFFNASVDIDVYLHKTIMILKKIIQSNCSSN